jgi:DNA invertase Pin-like site-specific DNA recombinase
MAKKAILYARVSSEEQAKGDAVSIDGQLADMRGLCERNGWLIHNTFIDCENYQATQQPKKGKVVSPSGERADRPGFLEMLDIVKSGAVDAVLCWRDDRLMRHPRVAVALEDALDVGDVNRNGKGKIVIHDATGATIDRFTLSIKAVIWREENVRRVERAKMGKIGTLKEGRWPGKYGRLGYSDRSEKGKRGRIIELGDPAEIKTVKDIFNWYDQGESVWDIAKKLIKRGDQQAGDNILYRWNPVVIFKILRAEDYAGIATWNFYDGTKLKINIPPIISREQ